MYYTFREAADYLGIDEKNNYQYIRIDRLVSCGKLEEAFPEIYIFDGSKYRKLDIRTDRLVTAESVHNYHSYKGKRISAEWQSGERKVFESVNDCIEHFNITRGQLKKPLNTGKCLDIDGNCIKFKYV
jgi:hypothetical protein